MTAAGLDTTAIAAWQVLTVRGELDCAVAPALRGMLSDLLDAGASAVVVDLSGVTLLDCACITVLVEAVDRAEAHGGELRLVGARGRVWRVLEITGATGQLGLDRGGVADLSRPGREEPAGKVEAGKVEAVLAARAVLPLADRRREVLRDAAVELCLPLAERLASRYHQARQSSDELTQVAMVGLLNAVDRFNPEHGTRFLSFALPTILGELRRHFRDHTWGVHVPRHLQELRLSINRVTGAMVQRLCRTPTVDELADHLDVPLADVCEAMVAAQGYTPASLSQRVRDGTTTELVDLVGEPDEAFDRVDDHESLGPLLARLPDHEQRVLAYRFFGNLTQTQVAWLLGVSQMQVSRLQSRALGRLREGLLADD